MRLRTTGLRHIGEPIFQLLQKTATKRFSSRELAIVFVGFLGFR
jgi:hypothetical protein